MKAAVIKDHMLIETKEMPTPTYDSDEVLISVKSVGVCGSDFHGWQTKNATNRPPGLIMGHETGGIVEAVGSAVTKFKKGDRVYIDPMLVCGECFYCRKDQRSGCVKGQILGSALKGFRHGALAEYVMLNQRQLFHLPDSITFDEATSIESVSCALHVMRKRLVKPGDIVLVLGSGHIGLLMLQAAKLAGARKIVVADLSDFRLNIARQLGATSVVNSGKEDLKAMLLELTDGYGVDVAIEAVGISATYQTCIDVLRYAGTLVFYGNATKLVELPLPLLLTKEINMIANTGSSNEEIAMAIELMQSKKFLVQPMITHCFELEDTQKAFETLQAGKDVLRVVIHPSSE